MAPEQGQQPLHRIHANIHINTTPPSAPAQNTLPQQSGMPQPSPVMPGQPGMDDGSGGDGTMGMGAAGTPGMPGQQMPQKPAPKPLPKKPPKESKPTKETMVARKRQTGVLKARQGRETQGRMKGGVRDADTGAGAWPPLSPFL